MEIGNLIIYDNDGVVWSQTGEATGNVKRTIYPKGIPYIEIPYGAMKNKRIVSVDVTEIPHKLVTEDITYEPTYEELESQLLLLENSKIEGGIF